MAIWPLGHGSGYVILVETAAGEWTVMAPLTRLRAQRFSGGSRNICNGTSAIQTSDIKPQLEPDQKSTIAAMLANVIPMLFMNCPMLLLK